MKSLLSCTYRYSNSFDLWDEDIRSITQELPRELSKLVLFLSAHSPYIKQLILKESLWLQSVMSMDIDTALKEVINSCWLNKNLELKSQIRIAKRRSTLIILLADFGGVFNLSEVTTALSIFADNILKLSMDVYVFNEFQRVNYSTLFVDTKNYPSSIVGAASKAGLLALGMGKLGSFELNYSSDIDLIFLFDEDKFHPEFYSKIRSVFISTIRKIVKALSEVTSEGYVFRIDLRLRPDPGSNPICIGMLSAQRYYENFGRNWERAAFIKARPISGNQLLGDQFLKSLTSFIWRKNLDFAAIADINEIRVKIRKKNKVALTPNLLGYNIKTGLGGIREIEFFVQTQQLISGGKNKMLRQRSTLGALGQLTDFYWVDVGVCRKLVESYEKLRFLEHILQLLDDAQTHSIPTDFKKVELVAKLFGVEKTDTFLTYVLELLKVVNNVVTELYSRLELASDQPQLSGKKSEVNEILSPYVNKWLTYSVLSSERSLVLFEGLHSLITARVLITETPSNTLFHFDNFLKSLSFGVQVFSLFKANPAVLELLIDICGAAPALAEYLERNPAVLDAVTDRSFFSSLPSKKELGVQLKAKVIETEDYEGVLDAARIFVKENQFMTGVHLLKAFSSIAEVSQSFSNIADVCLVILFDEVEKKFVQRYGRVPGLGTSILAMGKLGSKEMSIGSDLDLIIIYDAETDSVSNGKTELPAKVYFSRLTQAFISAITVATSEGHLFKVDMRLRPSGNKGTVATSISSFYLYQMNESWVWERLALSRGRVLNGKPALKNKIKEIISEVLNLKISPSLIKKEVKEMRTRLNENLPKFTLVDNLKLGPGRFQDLELLIQMGTLLKKCFEDVSPQSMITNLKKHSFFNYEETKLCMKAYNFYSSLHQILHITVTGKISEDSIDIIDVILKHHGLSDMPNSVTKTLRVYSHELNLIFNKKLLDG